jgi:hypothetical protein
MWGLHLAEEDLLGLLRTCKHPSPWLKSLELAYSTAVDADQTPSRGSLYDNDGPTGKWPKLPLQAGAAHESSLLDFLQQLSRDDEDVAAGISRRLENAGYPELAKAIRHSGAGLPDSRGRGVLSPTPTACPTETPTGTPTRPPLRGDQLPTPTPPAPGAQGAIS